MTQTAEIKASFDTTTTEGMMRVFNAQNGASTSLKNMDDNSTIEVTGVLQYPEKTTEYGSEQDVIVTVLFSEDGTSYASVSETVAKAGEKLIDFLKLSGLQKVNVKIIKQKSSRGQEFLNLQLVG